MPHGDATRLFVESMKNLAETVQQNDVLGFQLRLNDLRTAGHLLINNPTILKRLDRHLGGECSPSAALQYTLALLACAFDEYS